MAADDTNPSSGSVIIYIVIAVIVALFFIVAFFVWKRKQNRQKEDRAGYVLPSTTARSGISRNTHTTGGNTVFERRMDSTGYSSHQERKKVSQYQQQQSQQSQQSRQSRQSRSERPPQWPANGAPTYTRQQQQYEQHYPQQYQQSFQSHFDQSLYPPPPEVPMLETHDLAEPGPGMSMRDLQQSQVSVQSSVEGIHKKQIAPEVIQRTQEAVEKVLEELEADEDFQDRWIPYDSLYFTRSISKGAFAPEVLMGKKYTEKADIYSFGIVMSEMDTCAVPFSDKRDDAGKKLQGMKILQMVIRMGLRPSFKSDCPEPVKALADRCLDADPDNRPDAPELVDILRGIQDDLQ
ncbi:hypothetical protein PHYBOEH_008813 [Phytophthora boehmeriae]|uniref:Protein kinase domain-containing protein n=1 Tax=Phytophthora boehmeriae TaxID=109152 RepID=A0A8T1VX08_9STRA|nr:hypothetical protein PHYBOEH_008813 [Phytophthora boehmeriae]